MSVSNTLRICLCSQAFVAIGDYNGHVGLGVKCSKEVATAIRGAIILAKLSIVPVRRGYWGNKIGKPHTVPCKVTGRCGSVLVRLIPAPRGTGIVSAPVPKKLLMMAGIDDCYTSARGCTATLGNFGKILLKSQSLGFSSLCSASPLQWCSCRYQERKKRVLHGRKTLQWSYLFPLSVPNIFPNNSNSFFCFLPVTHCLVPSSAKATFDAISKTYSYLTPDLWKETVFTKSPYQVSTQPGLTPHLLVCEDFVCNQASCLFLFQEFTDHLAKTHTRVSVQRGQAVQAATS